VDQPAKPTTAERIRVTLNDWSSMVRYAALILLFLLAYVLLLRPMKKQLIATFRELPARVAAQDSKLGAPSSAELAGRDLSALSPDQRSAALKKQLVDKVKSEPAATGKLVQAWLNEGAR
jgi:flagellar M-ring protein FliF